MFSLHTLEVDRNLRFDVSVEYSVTVHVVYRFQQLEHVILDPRLRQIVPSSYTVSDLWESYP